MAQPSSIPGKPVDIAQRRVGTRAGNWPLEAVLGIGGMASVYASRDAQGPVAVKVLHSIYSTNEDVRTRFLREAELTGQIDHPGRVAIYDEGVTDEGDPYFVMELLDGIALDRLWKRSGHRLPAEYSLEVASQVLDLLAACHAQDIIHRDLKLPNVFITRGGAVKVLDFGVARKHEEGVERTLAGTALGTPAYMSPEQALGGALVDGRSDIFSVGAMLHALVSGQKLHQGRSEQEAFVLAATRPAPSVARVAPDLPAELVALIDRALSWDPRNRFQTAHQMQQEIARVLDTLRSGRASYVADDTASTTSRLLASIVEDGLETSPDSVDAANLESLKEIFVWLERCLASVRQYGLGHPQTDHQLGQLHKIVSEKLATDPEGVSWEVLPHSFQVRGTAVWDPIHPYDQIPYNLFASGFRSFCFQPGLGIEELGAFIDLLRLDPSRDFAPEDDLATAFWERQLVCVTYRVVGSLLLVGRGVFDGHAEIDELLRDAEGEIDHAHNGRQRSGTERLSLEARAIAISARANALRAVRSAGALSLTDGERQDLAACLDLPEDEWEDRAVDVLADAIVDAHSGGQLQLLVEPMRAAIYDQAAAQTLAPFLGVLQRVMDHAAHRVERGEDLARRLTQQIFDEGTLSTVLREVSRPLVHEADRQKIARCSAPLALFLNQLNASGFDSVLAAASRAELEEIRRPLFDYLARHALGNELKLGKLLAETDLARARTILAILNRLPSDDARLALRRAERNASAELRVEAVALRAQRSTSGLRDELARLATDADPSVRLAALRTMQRYKVKEAGPLLVQRIQSSDFHKLPMDERRTALDTLHALSPARAEAVALELSTKLNMITRDSFDETRIAALELLGNISVDASVAKQLEKVKNRWSNTEPVRAAASAAATAIRARMEARPS